MIDLIVKLEDALDMAGLDYELKYLPDKKVYVLGIDETEVFIMNVKEDSTDEKT